MAAAKKPVKRVGIAKKQPNRLSKTGIAGIRKAQMLRWRKFRKEKRRAKLEAAAAAKAEKGEAK